VRVDAFVADARDRPLIDLTSADFELLEDGDVQAIEAVRYVRADARLLAVYLDEYHVSAEAAERIRSRLLQFIEQEITPRDRLVVMKPLDSLLSITLSRDREHAKEAIATFAGRKGDYTAAHDYERQLMAGAPGAVDLARTQITVSALNALAIHLGLADPDARKTLIIVSEGFADVSERRRIQLPTMASVVQSANRSNVSIYTIDPREGAPGVPDESTLAGLASATDGRSIAGAGAVEEGLRRIAAESGAYYLITYRSPGRTDNRFHEIELRARRPGAKVRTRSGYWALSPDDLMRAEAAAFANTPPVTRDPEPPPRTSSLIRPWFGVSRGDNGLTRVTFVWEPAPAVPGNRTRTVPARLRFTALGAEGAPAYEGPVRPAGSLAPSDEGLPARAVFDVPPGRVRIRMSIEDSALRAIDSDVRDIAVRDLRAPVVLGTPEVFRARTAREVRALDADPVAAPVASRVFSRAERLVIRVPAYAPDGHPVVSATLTSRLGQPMRSLAVTPPVSPGGVSQIEVPLAGLASAEYAIEITATDPAGEARETIGFRVTP
jgi:VWFA-related protein